VGISRRSGRKELVSKNSRAPVQTPSHNATKYDISFLESINNEPIRRKLIELRIHRFELPLSAKELRGAMFITALDVKMRTASRVASLSLRNWYEKNPIHPA
jgi:hypothetical protein